MEREIKFRGYSEEDSKWVYGSLLLGEDGVPYIVEYCSDGGWIHEVKPDTVGQFKGLKDSNRQEIYEGDVLQSDGNILGIVVSSVRDGVSVMKRELRVSLRNYCFDSDFDYGQLCNIQVIGNVYDNTEYEYLK